MSASQTQAVQLAVSPVSLLRERSEILSNQFHHLHVIPLSAQPTAEKTYTNERQTSVRIKLEFRISRYLYLVIAYS